MSDDAPRDDTSRDNAPRDNAFIGNSNRDNDYSDHDYSDNSGGDNGSRNERDSLTVVGIGASAGGLGTLQNFLEVMPPDSGAAFVVVIHLAPDQESSFAELLAPRTTMSVLQVNDNRRLEPNHVYVISPGHNLVVADGEVRLEPLETRRESAAPLSTTSFGASPKPTKTGRSG
ncbi:MAG: chemotaxis protein CheB [Trueperaceae bacterium]|nr:chemotaxis protein CheB [Trueperaceae bacterium]